MHTKHLEEIGDQKHSSMRPCCYRLFN